MDDGISGITNAIIRNLNASIHDELSGNHG
jgi:hypothetical protein